MILGKIHCDSDILLCPFLDILYINIVCKHMFNDFLINSCLRCICPVLNMGLNLTAFPQFLLIGRDFRWLWYISNISARFLSSFKFKIKIQQSHSAFNNFKWHVFWLVRVYTGVLSSVWQSREAAISSYLAVKAQFMINWITCLHK
jgi:hypothetical protein